MTTIFENTYDNSADTCRPTRLDVMLSCRRLLEWGADTDSKTLLGETACHLAAYRGHSDVVRHLLAAGSDWTRRNWRGNDVVDEALSAANSRSAVTAALVLSVVGDSTPPSPGSTSPDAVEPSWSNTADDVNTIVAGLESKSCRTTF